MLPWLSRAMAPDTGPRPIDVAEAYRERAETMQQMVEKSRYCYEDFDEIEAKPAKKHLRPVILEPMKSVRDRFRSIAEWEREAIAAAIDAVASEQGISMGKLGQPLRVAVTGGAVSPPIDVTLELIGREKVLARMAHSIALIEDRAAADAG